MKEGWIKVYSSSDLVEVKLAEDLLKQEGIISNILSRPDSAIPSIGEAELYIHPDDAEAAVKILKEADIIKSS